MNTHTFDGPPPSVAERAKDEIYASDVNTLAQIFRSEFAGFLRNDPLVFGSVLRRVGQITMGAVSEHVFARGVFEDHGPQAILVALKQAYDHPEPFVSDTVEHE